MVKGMIDLFFFFFFFFFFLKADWQDFAHIMTPYFYLAVYI